MVVLGRISAPYGVQGWVRVHAFGDDPLSWRRMPEWWLGEEPDWQPRRLIACRMQGSTLVARFDGVDDRSGAEALVGRYVAAPKQALPANAPGEYYWDELDGLDVVNLDDQTLGRIEGLIETGASVVLRVRDGEAERLLPFVESVVREVDLAARRVRVDWQADW